MFKRFWRYFHEPSRTLKTVKHKKFTRDRVVTRSMQIFVSGLQISVAKFTHYGYFRNIDENTKNGTTVWHNSRHVWYIACRFFNDDNLSIWHICTKTERKGKYEWNERAITFGLIGDFSLIQVLLKSYWESWLICKRF